MRVVTIVFLLFILLIIGLANQGNIAWFSAIETAIPFADKIGHFVLIGGLALLVNLSLNGRTVQLFGRKILLGSLIVLIPITLEEISQLVLIHRTFDLVDLSADYLGIFAAGLLATSMLQKRDAATSRPSMHQP